MNAIPRTLLSVSRLTVGYGSDFRLDNINLELKAGEFLALIGPNGSGKSTLLRAISGSFPKYSGTVSFGQEELARMPARRIAQIMAMCVQAPLRPESMTVMDYVLLGRYPWLGFLGFFGKRDYEFARSSLKLCRLEAYANRRLESLSGGEWQSASLARAICQLMTSRPAILAPDEISSAMDPARSIEVFRLLASLCSDSLAVIAPVHDCNLAALFATHIMALKSGKVLFYGKVEDVFTEKNLQKLYDLPVGVFLHPDLGLPQLYPRFAPGVFPPAAPC